MSGTSAGIAESVNSSLRLAHRPVSLPVLRPAGVMRTNRSGAVTTPRRLPAGIGPEETSSEEISPQEISPQESSPQESSPQESSPQESSQ